ncbi:endonuclease, partial [Enterococcus faecalis]
MYLKKRGIFMEMEKFKDDLKSLGKRVTKLKENIATEEA